MKSSIFFIWIFLFWFGLSLPKSVDAQSEKRRDSLLGATDQADNPDHKLFLAEKLIRTDKARSLELAWECLIFARSADNPEMEAKAKLVLGKIYNSYNNYDTAIIYFDSSLRISRQINNKVIEVENLGSMLNIVGNQILICHR